MTSVLQSLKNTLLRPWILLSLMSMRSHSQETILKPITLQNQYHTIACDSLSTSSRSQAAFTNITQTQMSVVQTTALTDEVKAYEVLCFISF